ncbi:MAG: TetR/AcrR family transcriptional regulator [Coriobacteriia bacterium]|nr:TetR/AcrR family transcriptional regulator [Coriobacteriia bacterium]MCL2749894.1 TetR/AcrR family transcriptional regulator [Coriobacteriia bacterium]
MKQEKKEALAAFHRRTIQDAAEKLFLEKGVDATSIEEIAKDAGYSKATIYVYFKSKADIWDNTLLSAMKMLKEKVWGILDLELSTTEKYFALCQMNVEFSEEYPLFFEGLLGTVALEKSETNHQTYLVGEEILDAIGQIISQGIEEGIVRSNVQFPHITFYLWSCIGGIIRMTNNKEAYFSDSVGGSKRTFLQYAFATLLRSISV